VSRPLGAYYRRCESCLRYMPPARVHAFDDDGSVLFACDDEQECASYTTASQAARVGTEDGYNLRLAHMTRRLRDLEEWRRTLTVPDRWSEMVPVPHPPSNCGPLQLRLPPGAPCPTCGTVPVD
jgi:hypothetical protein